MPSPWSGHVTVMGSHVAENTGGGSRTHATKGEEHLWTMRDSETRAPLSNICAHCKNVLNKIWRAEFQTRLASKKETPQPAAS